MAKTLATYRDEAQATFDDDTILGDPIGREQSLEALGITLGIGLGHAPEVMSEQIRGGRVIAGLLA